MPADFKGDESQFPELNTPDAVIARNLRILERAFIPNLPELSDPIEEELASHWINKGETRSEGENVLMSAINIRFETKTGKIIKKPDFTDLSIKDGDFSVLNTFLIADGEQVNFNEKMQRWDTTTGTYKILLTYPSDWLTPHAINAAVNQGVDELSGEGNWILPERLIPERVREYGSGIAGVSEPWGQSQFMENPADKVLFETIEAFNKKHGPSLSDQLFRNLEIQEIPEPLSGKETAKLVETLYGIAGPRIGSILVESNIVLTLAGARGQTEFFINYPIEADKEIISKLNDALTEKGIRIRTIGDIEKRTDRPDFLMVSIDNLQGYERVSRMTSIPGVKPFDSKTGWEGFQAWNRECFIGVEEAHKQGKIPFPEQDIVHIIGGIHKGYPDIAIFDAMNWDVNKRKTPITHTDIPYVSIYHGAEPNFTIHPDHADDPSVTQIVDAWGQILEDFYASLWHQQIKTDKQFLEAREFNE